MNKISRKTLGSIIVTAVFALCLFLPIPAGAVDYQSLNLDELNNMRGTMTTAGTEEREAFRSARQSNAGTTPATQTGLFSPHPRAIRWSQISTLIRTFSDC